MKFYNTLSKKIEEFRPLNPPWVKMYSCGPTVYDFAHIGHFRTYVNTDILRRVLEKNGYKVYQVMNITDVGHLLGDRDLGEDKIELAARKEKKSAFEIAKFYEKDFWRAMRGLNVRRPSLICHATSHIKSMIALIKKLERKGFTYKTSDGVYFDTSKFKDYGRLSGMPLEKLKEGARVEVNPEKKNPTDFALWKFSPKKVKRQMEWESPWGVGFPGWHIECSAMSMKYLGESFDLHTGGVDHIPVHHTNEIAQSEAATGKRFVKYWFHNAFLEVEGKKMSKSLGNIFNQDDIKKRGFSLLDARYLFLTAHYRQKLNFTWEGLKAAQSALKSLGAQILNFKSQVSKRRAFSDGEVKEYQKRFLEAINNDLAIPQALSLMWEVVKSDLSPIEKLSLLLDFDKVFGLDIDKVGKVKIPKRVKDLVKQREKLRRQEKWNEADRIRKKVENLGFLIEDTREGPKLKPK